jgi:hypothetical protein
MGLRGPRARSLNHLVGGGERPWEAPGLSRAERVIAFCESLPCTSGQWAGQMAEEGVAPDLQDRRQWPAGDSHCGLVDGEGKRQNWPRKRIGAVSPLRTRKPASG